MMAKVFLKEDRYGEKLLKTLNVLRKERKYSDFYIETYSGLVPVHRVVLAAAESCHLKSKGFLCGDINTFDLTEFNKNVVEIFVSYLYTGEVYLTGDSDIKDFVNLCKKLEFKTLLNHKEFQKPNSNEISKNHTNELFEEDTVNSQDSDSEPHPVYLSTNRDGQMFVKSVPSIHSNDNQNTNVSNTSKLPESTEGPSLQELIIKQEPNSDDDSDNELDSIEAESSLTQSNKLKQKRPNKKTLKGKNKKLKSTTESVKQYAEQLVSKVVGMGEGGGDIEEDSGDNDDALGENEDEVGDADDQESEESQNDFVIKEEQDSDSDVTKDANSDTDKFETLKLAHVAESCKKGTTFMCDECGKSFNTKCGMNKHIRSKHRGEQGMPHQCTNCGYKCIEKHQMERHCRKYHGSEKLQCTYCNKLFTTQSGLKRHEISHHLLSPLLQCSECSLNFTRKDLLEDHVQAIHANNYRYTCSCCGAKYKWRGSLTKHFRTKHKKKIWNNIINIVT
ncbi:zinc finger protein with KRAB and SCAN domains 7-like isoform X3 [Mytilus californianus]|uniref:zinc finger protein with KRAB and SCAN domains 7-like isoform X3 n=1 Tax=Mytilus californianus TaxID=6549 RepID=UPI002245D38F|nr:zinc finger protein with KRAB and SCAN domains 7-like isoform X3 [Mytilus californianus]